MLAYRLKKEKEEPDKISRLKQEHEDFKRMLLDTESTTKMKPRKRETKDEQEMPLDIAKVIQESR